jgi:copper(I)-binding protein
MERTPFLTAGLLVMALTTAHAGDYQVGSLVVTDPWSNATPKGATVGAGYMKITNNGTVPDRLISGSTDSASRFEVHEMKMENGVMKMRPVQGGLTINPGQTVELSPGANHVMFRDLKKAFLMGDHIKASLMFEKSGTVDIEYDVLPMGAKLGHQMPTGNMQMRGMNMPGH